MSRWSWCVAAALACLFVSGGVASAATLYADPNGVSSGPCSQAQPCDIVTAAKNARDGDTVSVNPGTYTPSATIADAHTAQIIGTLGQSRPVVRSSADPAVMIAHDSGVSWLDIEASGATALMLPYNGINGGGPLFDHVVAHASATGGSACAFQKALLIIDSLCLDTGANSSAISAQFAHSGVAVAIDLDNVTALATNGVGIVASAVTGGNGAVNAHNTIAHGGTGPGQFDIAASTDGASGSSAAVVLNHSDYSTANAVAGASIRPGPWGVYTDPNPPNQSTPPVLTNDGHELSGSPTIGAGSVPSAVVFTNERAQFDFDLDPRSANYPGPCPSIDIGADQFEPPAAPAVASAAATVTGQTTATLNATVDARGGTGGWTVDYGPASTGATPPLATTSPVTCLPAASSSQPVSINLTGLSPGTRYAFRFDAFNAAGTTTPAFASTFTTQSRAPLDSNLALSPARFAAADAGPTVTAARSKGTEISYSDNQAATTTFTVLRLAAGRQQGHTCRKPSKRKRPGKRCTRSIAVGSFPHVDVAGANRFRFTGRVKNRKLPPGAYQLRAIPRNASGDLGPPLIRSFRVIR